MKLPIVEAITVAKRDGTVAEWAGGDRIAYRDEGTAVVGPAGEDTADGDSAMCAITSAEPDPEQEQGPLSTIRLEATLVRIASWTLVQLPTHVSEQLPSRGMTMAEGTLNGARFQAPLEPDGKGSHWFRVDDSLRDAAGAAVGERVTLVLAPVQDWPEPAVPADVQQALAAAPEAYALWQSITPKAHWDWIRWIRATSQLETRRRRIAVACSKLTAGMRRPCCFNRSLCTEPSVSQNGVLREPTPPAATAPH